MKKDRILSEDEEEPPCPGPINPRLPYYALVEAHKGVHDTYLDSTVVSFSFFITPSSGGSLSKSLARILGSFAGSVPLI